MKFSFIATAAIALMGVTAQSATVESCKYSFDSRLSSKMVTLKLVIDGANYQHQCALADIVNDDENKGALYQYACVSVQNLNVTTYLSIPVEKGYVWNSYNEAILFKADLKTELANCQRQ